MFETFKLKLKPVKQDTHHQTFWQYIHIDPVLLLLLIILSITGLLILYSGSNQHLHTIELQALHYLVAFGVMVVFAQIPPSTLQRSALFIYVLGLTLLAVVLVIGYTGKGAQRWLNLGFMRFQPAELMKLAIPLVMAWYYHKIHLPITSKSILIAIPIIFIPALLTAKQPDLTTAILLIISGVSVLFLAGLSWRIMISTSCFLALCIPFAWYFLHDYQRKRLLTFLSPGRDPLGKGYHIIQSKIAIGSGGVFGKGFLNGTQSNLHFLPEHSTDFIFAVCGEEFGLFGSLMLIILFMLIVIRGIYITIHAQDTFSRLLAGSITFTFFASFFINMGMVTGVLPVAGIPLPLVSYGGSSMVTMMGSLGILMSIQTHRKLVTT